MTLALFFSFDISARLWKETGLLEREKLIYKALLEKGAVDKIYWFTYGVNDKEIEKELKGSIEIIPMPEIFNSGVGRMFYSLILPIIHNKILKNIDILKTNQMSGSWTAVIAKFLFRKKLIVRTGYTWSLFSYKRKKSRLNRFIIKLIERFAYSFSDGITVSSRSDLEYLKNNYTLKGISKVIPNYIDTDIFKPLDVQKKSNSLCFVGRLNEQKNLISLLKALVGLPYTLNIIGSGDQGDNLNKYAEKTGIKVDFRGNIPNNNLPDLLNQNRVFILPSLYEGTPKALLEAMACGLPCIGTNIEGIQDIIRHNENGYLCAPDERSIKNAVTEVFENKILQERIARNARKTILESYSLEKALAKESELYTLLCH